MSKLRAIIAILRGESPPLPAGTLSPEKRKILVDNLRTKSRGALLSRGMFPIEVDPQAFGTFAGRCEAFNEAASDVESA